MSVFDQRNQKVRTQINVVGNIIEPTECHICGELKSPNEAYRCKRCRQAICISHRKEKDSPFCPSCAELVDFETKLFSSNDDVRFDVAQKLGGVKDPSTIPAIKKRLGVEANLTVRYWLAYALGKIGGEEAREILRELLEHDTHPFVQQGIQEALQILNQQSSPNKK